MVDLNRLYVISLVATDGVEYEITLDEDEALALRASLDAALPEEPKKR